MLIRSLQQRSSSHNYSLFTQRVFTQDWQNSNWITVACSVLPFISYHKGQQSDACTCMRMSLRNLYKCKQIVYFVYVHLCRVVVACLFVYPLFLYCTLLLLVYFFVPLLFLCWRCCYIFAYTLIMSIGVLFLFFGDFVYHLKNTYIIDYYNPSVGIIDLVSHTTYVECVNFIHKWRDLQFKATDMWQIFWETFHGNFICS